MGEPWSPSALSGRLGISLECRRALPGENQVQTGAGAPSMSNLKRNWASGIPPINYNKSHGECKYCGIGGR